MVQLHQKGNSCISHNLSAQRVIVGSVFLCTWLWFLAKFKRCEYYSYS